ncbi:MAG: cytochrome c2 [Paraglaciecola sp.]|jgi:cytochrome c2
MLSLRQLQKQVSCLCKNWLKKKAYKMIHKSLINSLLILIFSVLTFSAFGQEADIAAGKALFKAQCNQCHAKDMKSKLTGPALGGVEERWAEYPREDLYTWIRNSQAMIGAGHPRAVELWNEWKPTIMNPFPALTDAEMDNVLAYIDIVYTGKDKIGGGGPAEIVCVTPDEVGSDNKLMYGVLLFILALLAVVLARIIANLNYLNESEGGKVPARRKTLVDILTSKGVIGFVLFAVVVIGGFSTVNNAIELGRQQGYQPDQPIAFSHAIHACEQKIECQYCHDGARRSKHSVIPAANTCMNCHKAVKNGSRYGTAELTKIYASVGYDPSTDKYVEDYEEMEEADQMKIFKKWIADQAISNGETAEEAETAAENQWEDIKESLTDYETGDSSVAGAIEWVKIHNLPDHVYFNHAQHVSVGKIACQQCHGKVEGMDVVQQYAPLSMGWCINCHRQTEVKFADNDYYNSYEIYHEQMKNGERDKVTVEEVGGLECAKCHY